MPTIAESEIFDIVAALYETANNGDESAWLDVYRRMEKLFDAGHGGIYLYDKHADEFSRFIGTTPEWFYQEYLDDFQDVSPFRESATRINTGEYITRDGFFTDEEFLVLPIYSDYYSRGNVFHFIYLVFLKSDGRMGAITFSRAEGKETFSENQIRAMQFLLPHLERAFNFYLANLEAQIHTSLMQDAFDRLPQGVLLVEESLKIIYSNRAADTMLASGVCLARGRNGELIATKLENDRKLRRSLRKVIEATSKTEFSLSLPRAKGLRDLELSIASFTDSNVRTSANGRFAVVYLNDPDDVAPVNDEHLIQVYGLTNAEARIASLLCSGNSVADICTELGVAQNTCRTHIKRIFAKTNTNKQSELISLILSGSSHARRSL